MRCLALFTGGLDSQIAVRLMQRQGIEVIGIHLVPKFAHHANLFAAMKAAERLQIRLETEWDFQTLQAIKRPPFGYAEEMAPCLDCRIGMITRVQSRLQPLQASFIISGEVIGQRPSSLRSRDLETIAHHGSAEDLLLRPLSAQLLPATLPERNGWVDRSQLFDWQGRSRKEQLALAKEWNLEVHQHHLPGCLLLEPTFAAKLRRTLQQRDEPPYAELNCLSFGRHFWTERAHLVIGKNHEESETLREFAAVRPEHAIALSPENFRGPTSLLFGMADTATLEAAAAVIGNYSKPADTGERWLRITGPVSTGIRVPRQGDRPSDVHFVGLND